MPQFFIERPIFAWVVALAIALAGILAIPGMPVSQYPDVAPPTVNINATYPGASATDVSTNVASIIENELNGAKHLLYYESVSDSNGSAQITVTFEPGTDPDMAQVDVQNRISNVTAKLPAAVIDQGLKVSQSNSNFLMVVTLSSKDGSMSQTDLADYITRNIQNPVSRVKGVGNFQLFASSRAMRVWVDPQKLIGFNLSITEVNQAIGRQNMVISGGSLGSPPNPSNQTTATPLLVQGELTTPEEFGNIILRANPDGSTVRVSDVATVDLGSDNYQFGSRLNGKPTAAFALSLTPDANALETARLAKAKMKELAEFFPENIDYSIPYDTSPYVDISIEQVVHTLFEAMILVFLVMYLFLQDVRYTLIPALVVPVAMMGAFAVMSVLGLSINVLTMFAMVLAIGILVDDAIVVVENVERIMAEEGLPPKEATRKAMPQISGAIIGITLVLTTVFLPLAFMSGSVGIIYRQFSVAMSVSILFSALLALSFTPALCGTILKPIKKGEHTQKKGFFGWFNSGFDRTTHGYTNIVKFSLKRTLRVMLVFVMLAVLLGFMYLRLPTSFLPEEDQGYLITNIELPSGASSNRTVETIKQVEDYFLQLPQVDNVIAVQGFSFNGNGLNAALSFVTLKPFDERKGPGDSAQALAAEAMGKLLFGLPDSLVISIIPPAISSLGNAAGFDLRLEDRSGVGQDELQNAAQQLLQLASQSEILTDTRITGLSPGPQLKVEIDRDKAAALGVDFAEVAQLISTSIGSSYVGKYTNMGWVQNIWVQAGEDYRMRPDEILNLNAKNSSGQMVPLSSFVSYSWTTGPVQVVRYNGYESVRIGGSAAPGYSTGQAMDEMERLVGQLSPGLGFEWTGLSYQEIEAGDQSSILLGLSVLVIFMVLAALYESWAIPLSVMLAVPLGMLGTVMLSTFAHMANDVYFQVGMVTVIGLSAKNAILIVEFAKDLYASGAGLADAATQAARLRFRPILMTSFAFILGVVPLVLASGAGAASQNAVGYAVLGGMLAATPLAVLFVPAFFVVILRLFKTKPRLGSQAPHITIADVEGDSK